MFAGTRYLIYVDGGSAGIALVLAKYLRHRDIPDKEAPVGHLPDQFTDILGNTKDHNAKVRARNLTHLRQ
jgi:hypothetical protein